MFIKTTMLFNWTEVIRTEGEFSCTTALFFFCFIQMKPDVEVFFFDVADIMKKQHRQLIQVIIIIN